MTWVTALLVYFITWWMVFFVTLPFGVRAQEDPDPGTEPGAPARPRLGLKAAVTTVVSAVLLAIFLLVAESDLITFRQPVD